MENFELSGKARDFIRELRENEPNDYASYYSRVETNALISARLAELLTVCIGEQDKTHRQVVMDAIEVIGEHSLLLRDLYAVPLKSMKQ